MPEELRTFQALLVVRVPFCAADETDALEIAHDLALQEGGELVYLESVVRRYCRARENRSQVNQHLSL